MVVYAIDEEAARRCTLGSARVETYDGDDVIVPDFTRAMAADLDFLESRPEYPDPIDFAPFLQPHTAAWDEYFSKRKVVERVDDEGQVYLSVTSNRADVLDGKVKTPFRGLMPPKVKQFDVAALLTDQTLIHRFDISGTFRVAMRNLAAVDTARAALRLREYVRQFDGYERAEVVPGPYASSWKAARETLKLHAARFPPISVAVNAWFIGAKVFMYGDPDDEDGWRVFGPETVASLVKMVHAMVQATTPASVAFALGPELTLLDIDIHDGENVLCPVREKHAGPHDDMALVSSPRLSSFLTRDERDRLTQIAAACEVIAVDGDDCATAVRVSSKYVLLNSHVVAEGRPITAGGRPVVPFRLLSRDLWLARCSGDGVMWPMRDADVGEQVVLCYRCHDQLMFGGPVAVLTLGAGVMTLAKDACMQPGVSGAAVVALRDFALLGVYDGLTLTRALAAAYTPAMYTDMCMLDDDDSSSRSSVVVGEETGIVADMRRRGLGKMVAGAMSAMCPLETAGSHVGMGFSYNGALYTSCDPALGSLAVAAAEPSVFCAAGGGLHVADVQGLPPPPALLRAPAYGDEVFAVGVDAQGYYCSRDIGRVIHVGLGAKVFQVAGWAPSELTFSGGLVLSRSDAAVVGVYGGAAMSRDGVAVVHCLAAPARRVSVLPELKPEVHLAKLFPFLNPATWPAGVVESVLTHASASSTGEVLQTAYAMIGDSAMRTAAWQRYLADGVPASAWQGRIQVSQTNNAFAAKCEEIGLSVLLRVGGGFNPVKGSKVYADLLEAVAGAVSLYEKPDTFLVYCYAVGAVADDTGG